MKNSLDRRARGFSRVNLVRQPSLINRKCENYERHLRDTILCAYALTERCQILSNRGLIVIDA
jgi:hypothetical protein